MAFCSKCGAQMADGVGFCPSCGAEQSSSTQSSSTQSSFTDRVQGLNNTADTTGDFEAKDIEKNKGMAVIAYLSWLVIIPLLAVKDSKYVKYHVNQGLVLAICEAGFWIVSAVLRRVFWAICGFNLWNIYVLLCNILNLANVLFAVLAIIGIVNAVGGKAKELPVIGKFKLIK